MRSTQQVVGIGRWAAKCGCFRLSLRYKSYFLAVSVVIVLGIIWLQQTVFWDKLTAISAVNRDSIAVERWKSANELVHSVYRSAEVVSWWNTAESRCDGKFKGLGQQFAKLRDVVLDRGAILSERRGGEPLDSVLGQSEELEYLRLAQNRSVLELSCVFGESKVNGNGNGNGDETDRRLEYAFADPNNANNGLLQSTRLCRDGGGNCGAHAARETRPTLLVIRYEYVNLYHTMCDWYDTFLTLAAFDLRPDDVQVLFFDAHPEGSLDSTWSTLFHKFVRIGQLPADRTLFDTLVFVRWNRLSPLTDFPQVSLPLAEEFRSFFLLQHKVFHERSTLDCSRLRVSFVIRKPYGSHPRNYKQPSIYRQIVDTDGLISRMNLHLQNLSSLSKGHLAGHVEGVQLEKLSMHQQLHKIANSDILIGMHGAGLTHALFLPAYAGLIEFIPSYESGSHFSVISAWRNLRYERWKNDDTQLELDNKNTVVPFQVLQGKFAALLAQFNCPSVL